MEPAQLTNTGEDMNLKKTIAALTIAGVLAFVSKLIFTHVNATS